jgi:hypothetical protein
MDVIGQNALVHRAKARPEIHIAPARIAGDPFARCSVRTKDGIAVKDCTPGRFARCSKYRNELDFG